MSQNLLTPSIIANEALAILRNNLVMADLVHVDYSAEFVKVGETITVRTPANLVAKDFASEIDPQDLVEVPVTVKMDRFKDVSVTLTSKQQTLELKDFSSQVIEPAMVALAQQIDLDLCAFAYEKASSTVASTATPTNLKEIADLAKHLDKNKVPIPDRHLVMSPDHKYKYALTDNLSNVAYAGTNDTLRDALLGRIYTLNTYMDQNMPYSSAETMGTATSYKIASGTTGTVSITDGSGATHTLKEGDGFIYKGVIYRFDSDHTLSSSAKANVPTVPAFPAGVTTPVDAVLLPKASSVAFHRNAFALVNRQLDLPMGAARAAIASGEGISVRVVYDYNQTTKTDTISFDIIYGIATLREELAVRLAG